MADLYSNNKRLGSILELQYGGMGLNSLSRMCPSSRLISNLSYFHKTLKTVADLFQLLRGHILGTVCNNEIHSIHYCQWGVVVSISLCNTDHLQMVSHYLLQNLNKLLS